MDEVEDMGNIIKSEFLKLKRYYVVKAGIIMTVLSPLLTLFYSTANDGQTWTFDYFKKKKKSMTKSHALGIRITCIMLILGNLK